MIPRKPSDKKKSPPASNRHRHEIDATGKAVGRISAKAARLLIGKHKPTFVTYRDEGDAVHISHAGSVIFTGRKLVQKDYYHHTLHPGGLKRKPMKHVFEKDPREVVARAVWGMLPKNKHRKAIFRRLTIES